MNTGSPEVVWETSTINRNKEEFTESTDHQIVLNILFRTKSAGDNHE